MFDILHMYNLADMVKFLHWNKEDDLIISGVWEDGGEHNSLTSCWWLYKRVWPVWCVPHSLYFKIWHIQNGALRTPPDCRDRLLSDRSPQDGESPVHLRRDWPERKKHLARVHSPMFASLWWRCFVSWSEKWLTRMIKLFVGGSIQ